MNFRNRLVLGFGAALCILVIIGALSYRKFLQEDADQQWVSHTHQVLEKLDAILATLLELDSAEHGFILTKEEAYRQSSRRLATSIESQLKDVRAATADNPVQQAAVSQLEVLLNEQIALLKKAEEHAGSRIELGEDLNSEAITRIRAALLGMRAEEERLLDQRLQRAESGTRQMKFIVALGYGFSLLLFALTVYTVFREIEKRKRSEERMRNAQEQYRLLFDNNPIPVWVYDTATLSILDVNATAVTAYGYTREEFLRLKISDLRPAAEIPRLLTDLQESRQQAQESGPWKHQKKSGDIIDVQIRSYPLAFAGKNARLVVATDITDQQKAERALKESEERFRLIVSNIKDYAIIVLDPQGLVISWNGGAQRIKGYAAEDILGRHFSVFYPPDDVAAGKPVLELNAAREVGRFEDEGWRVRKDGSRFWANVVVTPLADDAGRLRGFVKTTRDITERRKAEQEILLRSQELETANRELEAFSYSVSHDLRAPLRGIEGFSQALQEDYEQQLDGTARDYLHRIRAATHRMGELIDDLLDLARVTRAEMYREPVDLSRLANEVAQELQSREPQREVALTIAEGLHAEGDSRLVRVALQNLIGNAWKFTSKRKQAEIEFGEKTANGDRAFFVRDNGAGFDPSYASRLFGAFQRLHAANEFPGSGIGLATVQRIVHRHGGAVWAEGIVNRGATIYFTLGRTHS